MFEAHVFPRVQELPVNVKAHSLASGNVNSFYRYIQILLAPMACAGGACVIAWPILGSEIALLVASQCGLYGGGWFLVFS